MSLVLLAATLAFAQPTPQQIQQHQMAIEQALRESQQREQQQHQAQIEQMEQLDRQAAEEAREQADRQAKAKAIAAQQQAYLQQQQAAQQASASTGDPGRNQPRPFQTNQTNPAQTQSSLPPTTGPPTSPTAAHWSFKNMSNPAKLALVGLGVILVALAFAAGILPGRFMRRWRNTRLS